MLHEHGFDCTSLHGNIPPVLRKKLFAAFTTKDSSSRLAPLPNRSSVYKTTIPHVSILVCTDVAARGLDLAAVAHVINFEMPRSVVDYLHRAG
jgi:superfamily II DNA/RNA helicase